MPVVSHLILPKPVTTSSPFLSAFSGLKARDIMPRVQTGQRNEARGYKKIPKGGGEGAEGGEGRRG